MARNGAGTYSLPAGNPVVTGTTISSTVQNNTLSDIASALTASIASDGQTPITANIPMSNHKFTGLSNGSASTDSVAYGQLTAAIANFADATSTSKGAGLIGFGPLNYAGGTVGAKLRESKSVLDYMSPAEVADVISNTGAVDVTSAINDAFADGFKLYHFPEGTYRITSSIVVPAGVSFFGDGISKTNINQVTADTGGFSSASAGLAYQYWAGFTITGAGKGSATSIGVLMGDSTHGADYCQLLNIESTNFGAANIRLVNGIRCSMNEIYVHGDPTGVLPAADIGLHLLGTYAFAGSNYDNRIGYVEAYNNATDIKVELGGKNNFEKVYTYNQNYTGTIHHIHELDSSLNCWRRPHVEPLSLSAGATAMWLIESTLANPYTYMLGPIIYDLEYENGSLATTTNVVQIGVNAENIVYGTQIVNGKWMPVSAGKYHVNLINEQSTQIIFPAARNNNVPFDRIIRELTVNNPNSSTNGSYIGSFYEESYGTWAPVLYADGTSGAGGAGSLATLTGSATWARTGKTVRVWLDVTLSAKTSKTGTVTIRGCEAITPNSGTTVFTASSIGAIVVQVLIVGLATAYPVYAYYNASTGYISFYNTTVNALLKETSFSNSTQIVISFEYPVA